MFALNDPFAEPIDAKRRSFDAGLSPFLTTWKQSFAFLPAPYTATAAARAEFVRSVRIALSNRFLFSNFIDVKITLHLDTQTVMESDAYGDLDNYAKSINDAFKGRDGLFIDDCQIYHQSIGFVLTHRVFFDVEIEANHEDDFVMKDGLRLYGMPDGLFYPQAVEWWDNGQLKRRSEFETFSGLLIWEGMSNNKRRLRHDLRLSGFSKLRAFQFTRHATPLQLGFHRSRAIASTIRMVEYKDWREACARFGQQDSRIDEVTKMMAAYENDLRRIQGGDT